MNAEYNGTRAFCREIGIAELIALQKLHPIKQFTTCADVQLAAPSLMAFKCAPSGLAERNTRERPLIYGYAYLSPRLQRCSSSSPALAALRCGEIRATVCDFLLRSLAQPRAESFSQVPVEIKYVTLLIYEDKQIISNTCVCLDRCDGLQ